MFHASTARWVMGVDDGAGGGGRDDEEGEAADVDVDDDNEEEEGGEIKEECATSASILRNCDKNLSVDSKSFESIFIGSSYGFTTGFFFPLSRLFGVTSPAPDPVPAPDPKCAAKSSSDTGVRRS